jgi:hypothetical protein
MPVPCTIREFAQSSECYLELCDYHPVLFLVSAQMTALEHRAVAPQGVRGIA